jgi:phage terminase large subunit GpA-like protein
MRLPLKSNIHSRINFELTPYLNEPCRFIGDSRVKILGALACTQAAKSIFLHIALFDMIDQDPGPALYILPDENTAGKHVERITNTLRASPDFQKYITKNKRDLSNYEITLNNMTLFSGWSGSNATLSSTPMKRVYWDEIRLMPLVSSGESNAIKLGNDRMTTYDDLGLSQGYMCSTPSVEGDLLYQQLHVPGTLVLGYQSQCQHCKEYQLLDFFKNVKWDEKAECARCVCSFCGWEFTDDDQKKSWNKFGKYAPMIFADGNFQPTRIYPNGDLEIPYTYAARMFFWWDSLVSPFRSFHKIATEYIQTRNKLHDYRNFWQAWLSKFWIDDVSKTNTIVLRERCAANFRIRTVPDAAQVLVAGIDTQDNGFYVCVRAFAKLGLTWLVDHFFIECRIDAAQEREIFSLFKRDIFDRQYLSVTGKPWQISSVGIDTGGHRTQAIYNVSMLLKRLFLVKGRNTQMQSIMFSKGSAYDLYLVRTCEYLDETEEAAFSASFILPHEVSITTDYRTQFCNIRKTREVNKKNGETKVVWKKIGQCDYRMADVHCYIALDIPTANGTLRQLLDQPQFLSNPAQMQQVQNVTHERNPQDNRRSNSSEQNDYSLNGGEDWF